MEGLWAVKTGNLLDLSEQQLVDCVTVGANGCKGGMVDEVYNSYTSSKFMMA